MGEIGYNSSNNEFNENRIFEDGTNLESKEHAETSFPSETQALKSSECSDKTNANETNISTQELAETTHDKTKQEILSEYSQYMSKEHIERLEDDETKNKVLVMNSETYTETFVNMPFEVVGHCDSEGCIYIKDISPEIVEHISTHETMHLCANRENYIDNRGTGIIESGIRESHYENGKLIADFNQGANEGLTEMYTLRNLIERNSLESAYSINSYSEARMWAQRLEKLIGSEKTAEAYFGGKKDALRQEFIKLNNNEINAWIQYSKDIDVLTYSENEYEITQAKYRLAMQYKTMAENKYNIVD